jgi:hypothetical protein
MGTNHELNFFYTILVGAVRSEKTNSADIIAVSLKCQKY